MTGDRVTWTVSGVPASDDNPAQSDGTCAYLSLGGPDADAMTTWGAIPDYPGHNWITDLWLTEPRYRWQHGDIDDALARARAEGAADALRDAAHRLRASTEGLDVIRSLRDKRRAGWSGEHNLALIDATLAVAKWLIEQADGTQKEATSDDALQG